MVQLSLLADSLDCSEAVAIPGLRYLPDFIDGGSEAVLIATIDQQPWRNDLKRRVVRLAWSETASNLLCGTL